MILSLAEYDRLVRAAEPSAVKQEPVADEGPFIDAGDAALQLAGSWIERTRREKGWTQQQLAQRVGVPQSQISRIERRPDRTTVRTMKKIAAALGVDVSAMTNFRNEAVITDRRAIDQIRREASRR